MAISKMTMHPRGGSALPPFLLLSAIRAVLGQSPYRGISFPELIAPWVQRAYDPQKPSETCYDVLWASDANGDGVLQNYEYTSFVADLSDGDFDEENYVDLPFALKVNFIYLSCLCRFFPDDGDPASGQCCEGPEGGIDVTAADPNKGIALGEEDDPYLRTVCAETQGAIEYAREEEGFTGRPSAAPTEGPTSSPSADPTPSPSESPTEKPTLSPFAGPTESPTPPPSVGPTTRPTPSPSAGPTESPSNLPSAEPTSSPSAEPTSSPSAEPTSSPSADPTSSPSADPTENPTPSPSAEPTSSPSAGPTKSPSDPPSKSPSVQPTESPSTAAPTGGPTLQPVTDGPTKSPTPVPSKSPATEPTTEGPSTSPTASPTPAPSKSPTTEPVTPEPTTPVPVTGDPTVSPSKSPIIGTGRPTKEPNDAPTKSPIIGTGAPTVSPSTKTPIVGTGAPTASPFTKAPIIGTGAPTASPSTKAPIIGTGAPTASPSTKAPSNTGAPTAASSTKAPIVGTAAPTTAKPTLVRVTTAPTARTPGVTFYPSASSRPTTITPEVTPPLSSPGGVESPPNPPDRPDGELETLTAVQAIGIAIVAALIGSAAVYVYYNRRKRGRDEDPELQDVKNKDLEDLEVGRPPQELPGDDVPGLTRIGGGGSSGGSDGGSMDSDGAIKLPTDRFTAGSDSKGSDIAVYDGEPYDSPDYIPGSSSASGASPRGGPGSPPASSHDVVTGLDRVPASPRRRGEGTDSSSAASESGWSSSAGMSSLNTGSFDDRTDDGLLPGSPDRLLAAIGAADTVARTAGSTRRDDKPSFVPVEDQADSRGSRESSGGSSENPMGSRRMDPLAIHSGGSARSPPAKVSREDLNAAIEAGDWAMVGATAALLADSAHYSDQSHSGSEGLSGNNRSIVSSSSHSAASDSVNSSAHRAQELDRMVVRGDWEGVVLAAAQFEGTPSRNPDEDTMGAQSMSVTEGSRSKEEVRAEVERLVRRVVPDELENIDEMMLQFEGREEELIETLRTMQERNVAQRARAAVQKTAKLEARAKASLSSTASGASAPATDFRLRAHSGSMSSEPSHYAGSSHAGSSEVSDYHDDSTHSSVSDLEMSDQDSSKNTAHSSLELAIERGDWRAVGEAAAMMGGPSALMPGSPGDDSLSSGLSESAGQSERAYYLDALIARGDWAGIVAAAGKYQAMDDRTTEGMGGYPPTEEEREALAQATMWENIANKSRQDAGSAEAQGALDAADWAISRSLERKMRGDEDVTLGGDPDAKKPRIEDDESV